jgi:hypothetical protein
MSDALDRWLTDDGEADVEIADDDEQAAINSLATDAFAWLDELVAERRGIDVDELRRGYVRGKRRGPR